MAYEWIPYVASAAASMVGAGIQNSGSSASQGRAYRYQRELMGYSNDLSMQNYKDMFDYEYRMNSPYNQMRRMQEAGINPYVAASQQGVGKSETSVGAPTAPSGAAPSMYTPSNIMADIPQGIVNIAQAFKSISETKGQDIENEYQKDTLMNRIRASSAALESQELQNSILKWDSLCASIYKIPSAKATLNKINEEVALLSANKENLSADTVLKNAQSSLANMQSELTGKQKELLDKQMPLLISQLEESVNLIREQQKTEKSKQALNSASAEEARSMVRFNLSKEEGQRILNKYLPQLQQYDVVLKRFEAEGTYLHNKSEAQNMIMAAKKFLPEIRKVFAEGSEIYKKIEYTEELIKKIPHEIDKLDSETWKNFASGLKDVMQSAQIVEDMLLPF